MNKNFNTVTYIIVTENSAYKFFFLTETKIKIIYKF